MADGTLRQGRMRRGLSRRALAPLLAPLAAALGAAPAEASVLEHAAELLRLDPHNAIGLSLLLGLTIFATTTALLHLHERTRWSRRERALNGEIASLRGADDRAEMLIGSERQLVVSWSGRDGEPAFEGDPTVVGEAANARRALAFGSWLAAVDATALERALEKLRERGEGFHLTLRTLRQRFVEAEGRTVTGRALLRLRDVTGDRLEVMRLMRELAKGEDELKSLRGLLDAIPQPVWLRARDGALGWANEAYLRAVEATDAPDARARGLELLDRADRDESGRRRRLRGPGRRRRRRRPAHARRDRERDPGRQRRHRHRHFGARSSTQRPPAPDGGACPHARPAADRGRDLRRKAAPRLPQRRLPPALGSRPGVSRIRPLGRRDPRSAARRPQAPRAGGFPQLEGRSALRLPGRRAAGELVAPARPAHAQGHRQPEPAGRPHLPLRRRHRARPSRGALQLFDPGATRDSRRP